MKKLATKNRKQKIKKPVKNNNISKSVGVSAKATITITRANGSVEVYNAA